MPSYKILFLDIDGTILTPDDTIEASTKEAVKQVKDKGVDVFLATGRPLHEIQEIGEELNIESFIGYNGAYAVHRGKDVFLEPMEAETIQFFLDTAKQKGHEAVMYTNGKNLFTNGDSKLTKEFIKTFHLKQNEPFDAKYIDDILGVTLLNVGKNEPSLYEKEGSIHLSTVNVAGVKDHAYDVIRDHVNKGIAVQQVLDLLGIDKSEAIAFGDGMNDKEMLSLVGEGFAMGNAHPDLHEFANRQTTDVTDSGVYNGLKALGVVRVD
ncbi:Cof-type HAD-IIB family hydrolase [Bacillus shivajii]|uniref:HAD family hydrolase n=1 Tax=Bacillus shivajii TaxID=1983719 RepID=UPI001CF9440D|nr:HAD family hydrolase [Bacillus shivajii]UCZ52869.1 Cof-type HAD-IIB family hydrolase [Bacillus shivajii]